MAGAQQNENHCVFFCSGFFVEHRYNIDAEVGRGHGRIDLTCAWVRQGGARWQIGEQRLLDVVVVNSMPDVTNIIIMIYTLNLTKNR